MSEDERDEEQFSRVAAPLGWAVSACVRARRSWMAARAVRLGIPVISVGNLAMGGTGKTPLVRHVAGWLATRGVHVAVLSRGYGRPRPVPGVLRVSRRGAVEAMRWELAGDEPWMLAHALPAASVYVAGDRVAAGRAAMEDGAQVLLLDDGFQHLRLARDLDIVCLRGDEHRCGVLPAGPLREPLSALTAAHAVVRMSVSPGAASLDAPDGDPGEAPAGDDRAGLRGRVPEGVLWCEARVAAREVILADGTSALPGALQGSPVGLLCAIARHERFVAAVRALGVRIEAVHARRDHHVFEEGELENLRQDLTWVTTEKDAARLPRWFQVAVLRVGLHFRVGGDELRGLVFRAAGCDAGVAEG
jgi:tetraacyldisaccharide 4'-kinase